METRRKGETVASQMKKLFLTEFDGSDKIADYSDIYNRKVKEKMQKRLTLERQ